MRIRLMLAFILFTVLVLAFLWLFQTIFIDDIYRALKLRDINKCASAASALIEEQPDNDSVSARMTELSKKYGMCISVYKIVGEGTRKSGELIVDRHVNTFCFIHNLRTPEWISRVYSAAVDAGGEYRDSISFSELFGTGENDDMGNNEIVARVEKNTKSEYLFIFNSELAPLSATKTTLRVELAFISVILIVSALILSLIISSRISKPIQKMSKEASKLALGSYDVNFDGGSTSETQTLARALNGAANELSKLDRMQKDLIANVSHDLRTPLTMISGYTEAMRDLPGEATAENMQIVLDETKRLSSLVNDLVDVSRYQGGSQTLRKTVFNFTDVVKTTLGRYAKLREKDGYSITFECERDVYVNADEGRILQVVYNLVNNAVNYTGEDKVVVIRQTVSDGEVTLTVADTGCGIPEDQLPLVWERYYKVHDYHKRENMGTGLGLSIVKSILLLHGARFGVNSTVGKGSTFWFTLDTEESSVS